MAVTYRRGIPLLLPILQVCVVMTTTLVCLAAAQNSSIVFQQQPSSAKVLTETNSMFMCAVSSLPENFHIVWIRNGKPISVDRTYLDDSLGPRFTLMGFGSRINMFIQPTKIEDHGSAFSCRVYNGSISSGSAVLVKESTTAMLTVLYSPPSDFPKCRINLNQSFDNDVDVVLSCCTEISSIPLELSWNTNRENVSWKVTTVTSTGYDITQECVKYNLHSGLDFGLYQCKLDSASSYDLTFATRSCRVAQLNSVMITLKYLDNRNLQFNCTSSSSSHRQQYLWHLQDGNKEEIEQLSPLSTDSILNLRYGQVSNGSYLSCSIFDGDKMGTADLKIVLSSPPEGGNNQTMLIIGLAVGAIILVLIVGLSMYFLLVKWKRRNDRLYASLERGSDIGAQGNPSNMYMFHKSSSNANGGLNGNVTNIDIGRMDSESEIPPKPGGHRTISWEPEDIVIRSNGGVINHSEDPKKRNVEGLVYADLAFKEGEGDEEQDAQGDDERQEALGAVGGEVTSPKGAPARINSIEYASIVPPPRSLRF